MPNYDYVCAKCEKTFEVFQSMKDKPLTRCPDKACKGRVKRLLGTGAGLIFKGSGFYITDYRSEGYKSAAKSDTAAATASSSPASDGGGGGSAKPAETKKAPSSAAGGEGKAASKGKKASG
jgi:putative FmdB family regulatory protein